MGSALARLNGEDGRRDAKRRRTERIMENAHAEVVRKL